MLQWGVPDGLFSYQVTKFLCILEFLRAENFGTLYDGHLVYFSVIWYTFVIIWHILLSFGIFSPLWYVAPKKIWQPWCNADFQNDEKRESWLFYPVDLLYRGKILAIFLKSNVMSILYIHNLLHFESKLRMSRQFIIWNISKIITLIPGVDVMITIFCYFCQFSAKQIGVFLKHQCYD
jgi:hypothetical protein